MRIVRRFTTFTAKTLGFHRADVAFTPTFTDVFPALAPINQRMAAFAGFLLMIASRSTAGIRQRRRWLNMKRINAPLVIALYVIQGLSIGNVANAYGVRDAIGESVVVRGFQPESGSIRFSEKGTMPLPATGSDFNLRPESTQFSLGKFVPHEMRILSNWLQPCDGKKAEECESKHRERLNERTPATMGDAIVRSHANVKHERAAEMTALALASYYVYDARAITNSYGAIQDQVSTLAAFMNLLENGPMNEPISNIGIRGYTFLARLQPNWNMGFRAEGTTGVGTSGNQGLAQSTVSLAYAYVPITITGQAEVLTKGNEKAFMQAKALEAKFDMKDIVSHVNVVMVGANRGGQLAQVATGSGGGTTFTADNTALLPGALYLRVGQIIETGAVGGGVSSMTGATITSINYATRAVVTSGATGTCVDGDAVYINGEAAQSTGAFPLTSEGLISLVSDSGSRQGLNPSTSGQSSWASFVQDVGGVDLSSASIQEQISFTKNRSGEDPDVGIYPSAQINRLVQIATNNIRFDIQADSGSIGKKANDLGFATFTYAGRTIIEDKDARPDRTAWGKGSMIRKFEAVPLSLAEDEAGTWTRIIASGGIADATAGLLRWYIQLGIMQRSAWSFYQDYSVPPAFLLNPPTI